jgi:hypothetical protein
LPPIPWGQTRTTRESTRTEIYTIVQESVRTITQEFFTFILGHGSSYVQHHGSTWTWAQGIDAKRDTEHPETFI